MDREGYVLSAAHLVRDARGEILPLVEVELADEIHFQAAVIGAEPSLDLAVLRVVDRAPVGNAAGAELQFADSDRLAVGHWVIALGDPPGAEKTFAVGVVSAPPARQCYQEHLSATLLQTSLAVPPSGLGGPVVDIYGRVAGISVRRAQEVDVGGVPASGTLPINLVLNLYEALKVAQSVRSPWIGISVLELALVRTRREAGGQPLDLPAAGVYVDDVFAPSPAAQAGVRPGDFLIAMGGRRVASVADFQTALYTLGIGAEIELDLLRAGKPVRASVTIEARPEAATTR
jgi:S1-C subfamily serine protease